MVENLRRGDIVVTAGGIIGKISKVIDDNEIELRARRGRRASAWSRGMIAEVRAKSEPVKDDAAG